MPKITKPLTLKQIKSLKTPGFTSIGHVPGLCMKVTKDLRRYYILRYSYKHKVKCVTIGNADVLTFPVAKKMALKYARQVAEGIDAAAWKREQNRAENEVPKPKKEPAHPFYQVAEEYLEFKKEGGAFVHSIKGIKDFYGMMIRYVYPTLKFKDVSEIEQNDILEVLKIVWTDKPALSDKLKRNIKGVIDFSILKKYRLDPNPVDAGSLNIVLNQLKAKRKQISHHPALSWKDIPMFIYALYQKETTGAYALIFSILTATRSKAVRFMTWNEIDFKKAEWNIPLEHDKTKKINANRTIYLSKATIQLLKYVKKRDELVFASSSCKVLTDSVFGKIIRDMNAERINFNLEPFVDFNIKDPKTGKPSNITQHGTARASYRSWAAADENQDKQYNVDAIELNLLHERKDPLKGAYDRSKHEQERKRIMEDWGKLCTSLLPQDFWDKE